MTPRGTLTGMQDPAGEGLQCYYSTSETIVPWGDTGRDCSRWCGGVGGVGGVDSVGVGGVGGVDGVGSR